MIINKKMSQFKGIIEYSYRPSYKEIRDQGITEDDLDCMWEADTFESLNELIDKMQESELQKIRDTFDVEDVWISNITFNGTSEDGETTAQIMFADSSKRGHLSTKIENEDINSRLLTNLEKVKRIIDNTLDEYPVKY